MKGSAQCCAAQQRQTMGNAIHVRPVSACSRGRAYPWKVASSVGDEMNHQRVKLYTMAQTGRWCACMMYAIGALDAEPYSNTCASRPPPMKRGKMSRK